MRDINDFKFRGYDTEYKKMTYFDDEDYLLLYGQILRSKIEWNYDYDEERIGYEDANNKIILMQYTGLHDKNGKEIYENDIVYVSGEDENAIIEWDEETARFIIHFDGWIADFDNYYGKELEVRGDKYNNPELLGGE